MSPEQGDQPRRSRSADTARPPGYATRVVDAQRQAVRAMVLAGFFVVAAPIAALTDPSTGRWLPIHLFLAGALLSAIVGATQLLAVTWSAAPAPSPVLTALQRWALAAGVLGVTLGRETDADIVVIAGGIGVGIALTALLVGLLQIRTLADKDRFLPAISTYVMAICWALAGVALGVVLAVIEAAEWWSRLRSVHVAIGLFGLIGLVVAGTLPYFAATQVRMKMSDRASPARMRRLFGAMSVSVAVVVCGSLFESEWLSFVGYGVWTVSLAALLMLLPRPGAKQLSWAGPRLVQLASGILWWIVASGLFAASTVTDSVEVNTAVLTLVVGGFAQILVSSLAYFGPVLVAGGHKRLTRGFAITRSYPSLVAGNVAAFGALFGVRSLLLGALLAWLADTAVRGARLAVLSTREPSTTGS